MAGHTAGPWHLAKSGLTVLAGPPDAQAGWPQGIRVASTDSTLPLAIRQANARLIAAAPDLLAACKKAKERFDQLGMDWLGKGPDPLEEAIARAEGS